MPIESASSPATLSETMRRVRLEKLWVMKNCQARRNSRRCCAQAVRRRDRALAVSPRVSASTGANAAGAASGLCDFCGSVEHVALPGLGHARVHCYRAPAAPSVSTGTLSRPRSGAMDRMAMRRFRRSATRFYASLKR